MENQKTLEQVIQEASKGYTGAMNCLPVDSGEARTIAAAVREWMREQNEGLRGVIAGAVNLNVPGSSGIRTADIVDAILSVIPPRMIYDPRPLQAEIDGWKTAARIVELEDLCGEYSNKLTEVKALLDKLRPIRSDQESRIEQTKTHISNGLKSGNGHYIEQADAVLGEFLDEMQKAKAIHAEIDSIIEKVQISQMEEQRKEFDSGGISPAAMQAVYALKQENKRLKQKIDEEVRITIGISDKAMKYDKIVESMKTGKVFIPGISPAEADDLDAMLKLHLANQRGLTKEESESLSQFLREQGDPMNPAEEPLDIGKPDDISNVWGDRAVAEKAKQYDALREKFPFLPGEYFYTFFQGSITRWQVCDLKFDNDNSGTIRVTGWRERPGMNWLRSPVYRISEIYATPQELISKLEVVE